MTIECFISWIILRWQFQAHEMGTMIAWIWFLYQLLPRQVYPGWDTLSYIAVGNQAIWCYTVFVLRSLHYVSLEDVWSQQQNPEQSRWVEREDWCHGLNGGRWQYRLMWATLALGARCKQSSGLESLGNRKKVMIQVPDQMAVTCKRVVCVKHGTQEVVVPGCVC